MATITAKIDEESLRHFQSDRLGEVRSSLEFVQRVEGIVTRCLGQSSKTRH